MEVEANETSVAETRSAVGFVLNMPPDDVMGYIVIGVKADGMMRWTSNSVDYAQVVARMGILIADIAYSTPLVVHIPTDPP